MRNMFCFFLFSVALFTSSCQLSSRKLDLFNGEYPNEETVQQVREENAKLELNNAIIGRFEEIRKKIDEGKIDAAEQDLLLLEQLTGYDREINTLKQLVANARQQFAEKSKKDLSRQTMLAETESRFLLPSTYEKVLVIDSNLPPNELPPGAMEELVNRKISVTMDKAGVKELVQVLSREGLNVVADDALDSGKQLSISVKDVPLKELFAYVARNMGIAFHLGENLIWITKGEEEGGAQLETRIIRMRQGLIPKVPSGSAAPGSELGGLATPVGEEDNDLEEALTTFFATSPEGAAFRIFRNRNILMIRDTRENLRLVENMVKELDQPPYQVVIEAKFITVSQDDLRDLGVEIKQKLTPPVKEYNADGPNAVKETNLLTSLGALAIDAESGVGFLQLNGVLGRRAFDIAISALESKKSSTMLSAPKVTVMNNRTARIRKGETLKYFEEFDIETLDKGDTAGTKYVLVPTGTPTDLLLGITFDVRVNIGNDGRTVLLGLNPEIVEFLRWENYATGESSNVKLPYTYEQKVATTVGVSSGQTVVLGGMLENTKSKQVKQVPFLGDLPLIGFFFRHTEDISIPTNLLIFVTANVINSRGEFLDVRQPDTQPAEQ